jgi:hypothetical protein
MAGIAAGIMKGVGSVLEIEGHRQAGESAKLTGQRRNVAAQFQAVQLEQQAGQSVAASQRVALEEKRKANLFASRALALAGASGGGASDPTVVRIIASIVGEGSYRAAVAHYRGEDEARKLRTGAKVARYQGALAEMAGLEEQTAHEIGGFAAALSGGASFLRPSNTPDPLDGASSLSDRYGNGGWQDAGSQGMGSYG